MFVGITYLQNIYDNQLTKLSQTDIFQTTVTNDINIIVHIVSYSSYVVRCI